MHLWSDVQDAPEIRRCVSHREKLEPLAPLPIPPERAASATGNIKVASAAQAFNVEDPTMSSWMAGKDL